MLRGTGIRCNEAIEPILNPSRISHEGFTRRIPSIIDSRTSSGHWKTFAFLYIMLNLSNLDTQLEMFTV